MKNKKWTGSSTLRARKRLTKHLEQIRACDAAIEQLLGKFDTNGDPDILLTAEHSAVRVF